MEKFKILNGRGSFYQWDFDQKLVVLDDTVTEAHFPLGTERCPPLPVYEYNGQRVVDVPNILLQTDGVKRVYAFVEDDRGGRTICTETFRVNAKPKPDDYIYTETELWTAEKAVQKALQEAKDSGDFKGDPGPKGDPGKDGVGQRYPGSTGETFNNNSTNTNKAPGGQSSARNYQNEANADCSDVSGHGNKVNGYAGHGQNRAVTVNGYAADAGGEGTVANGLAQFVRGCYNEIDKTAPDPQPDYASRKKGKYLEIIGNGSSSKRSNARTLDWDGNGWFAGKQTAKDFVLDGYTDSLGSMLGLRAAVGTMQGTLGNDIMVINPTEAGTLILQENTYYQFLGSSEKKTLSFFNSDNSVAKTMTFQMLTIHCGSMTDSGKYGIAQNMPTAMLYVIGNDTSGLSALTGAETGCYGFKKNYPDGSPNAVFRAEVAYPANSVIVMQTKSANPLPPITKEE